MKKGAVFEITVSSISDNKQKNDILIEFLGANI